MSLFNGDKSRAHRVRKQNIQRRLRTHALLQSEAGKPKAAGERKQVKPTSHPQPAAQQS